MVEPHGRGADSRFAFLDALRELPSLPQVFVRISKVASDPGASASDLSEVILRDQALTLKVLRVANSARYALYAQKVTTVTRAVMLLGFQSVRAVSLGLGGFRLLSSLEKGGKVLEGFWRDAVSTAVACQELAGLFGMIVPEEAFVAGLLHDAGKLVLAQHDPDGAARLYAGALGGRELLAAERAAFGVDHAEVAEEIARRWDLPEVLRKAMAHHHRSYPAPPADRGDLLAFLVGVGRTLVAPAQDDRDRDDRAAKMARVLRKPVGSLVAILQALPEKVREYAGFFEIEMGDLREYTLWVEAENRRLTDAFSQQEEERRHTERRQAEMTAIREVHSLLVGDQGPEGAVRRVLRAAREVVGARRTVLALLSADGRELKPASADGDVTPDFLEAFRFPVGEGGVLAEALQSGQAVHVFDVTLPYFARLLSAREAKVLDAASFAALPVTRGTGSGGLLYADRNDGDEPFRDDEVESLSTLAQLASLALRS